MARNWRNYQTKSAKANFPKIRIFSRLMGKITNTFGFMIISALVLTALTVLYVKRPASPQPAKKMEGLLAKVIAGLKPSAINSKEIFKEVKLGDDSTSYYYKLALDEKLQTSLEKLLNQYKPPYAAIVAMEPNSGAIIAMASYSKVDSGDTNWCLKSSFSAASIFKLVTTAAAIEKINMQEDSLVGFNGGLYRLHERNVFDKRKKYSTTMTLGEAFAKSVNIVFAKLTQRGLKSTDLKQYSSSFLFNRPIPFDLDVEESVANIPEEDYRLAKTAAGFGDVTLSPLHGAVMVSAILNNGSVVAPYLVDRIYDDERSLVYKREPSFSGNVTDPSTAKTIKDMMEMTLTKGTIRKSFRGWSRDKVLSDLNIGGKTGSLNGQHLLGEHNWFVGFAEDGAKKIVVSSVIVNHPLWHIKPSYLAKIAIQNYFSSKDREKIFVASSR